MFNSYLPSSLLTVKYESNPCFHVKTISYQIKSNTGRYIINAEEYIKDTYVLKFYPAEYKNHGKKFQLITGSNMVNVVIGTCIQLFKTFYVQNDKASFGFLATPSILGNFQEEKANNQRFRIYKQTMHNYFGNDTFSHFIDVENSAYLMVNRSNDIGSYVFEMQHKFIEMYPEMFNLQFSEL